MNKRVLLFPVLLIAIFFTFRYCSDKPENVVEEKPVPLAVSRNSADFNQLFSRLLDSYYALKEAFVNTDTVKVNSAAAELARNADSLDVNQISGDSSGTVRETAKYFAGTISGSAKGIAGEQELNNKLREFNMITDALWSLTRTVQFDRQKIYYHFCPVAFDNTGAYWLSDKKDTRNPYTAINSTSCGEVTDSVDYSNR